MEKSSPLRALTLLTMALLDLSFYVDEKQLRGEMWGLCGYKELSAMYTRPG